MRFEEPEYLAVARAHLLQAARLGRQWSKRSPVRKQLFRVLALFGIIVFLFYKSVIAPPSDFPTGALIKVREGTTLRAAAGMLKEAHLVRSTIMFEAGVALFGGERSIVAGNYFFPKTQNVLTIGARFASGDFEIDPARVTIPEGANTREIARILKDHVLGFDEEEFLTLAEPKEGYLFPDTYFFIPGEEPEAVLARMEDNFNEQISNAPN